MKRDGDHTYTLTLTVRDRPGMLVRCAQVYGRRGHKIEALHVTPTDDHTYSFMTITAFGQLHAIDQIVAGLKKLVDVQSVQEGEG